MSNKSSGWIPCSTREDVDALEQSIESSERPVIGLANENYSLFSEVLSPRIHCGKHLYCTLVDDGQLGVCIGKDVFDLFGVYRISIGTTTAPSLATANQRIGCSMQLGSINTMRSPLRTPNKHNA